MHDGLKESKFSEDSVETNFFESKKELVPLNILIHRMIINQTETSCFTPAVEENRSNDCAFHHVDNQQKSRNSGNDNNQ